MLKNGLAALLIGLLVFGAVPATGATPQESCPTVGTRCCCDTCPCPVKDGVSCVSCVPEKAHLTLVPLQETAKPRVDVALYLLPVSQSIDVRPFFARSIRGLDPSPPSGGSAHQALLRLWLI